MMAASPRAACSTPGDQIVFDPDQWEDLLFARTGRWSRREKRGLSIEKIKQRIFKILKIAATLR
jgi:hypothetical protein